CLHPFPSPALWDLYGQLPRYPSLPAAPAPLFRATHPVIRINDRRPFGRCSLRYSTIPAPVGTDLHPFHNTEEPRRFVPNRPAVHAPLGKAASYSRTTLPARVHVVVRSPCPDFPCVLPRRESRV